MTVLLMPPSNAIQGEVLLIQRCESAEMGIVPRQSTSTVHPERSRKMIFLLLLLLPASGFAEENSCPAPPTSTSSTDMLLDIAHPCRYDRFAVPPTSDGGPTTVSTHVHVYFLGSIESQSLFAAHLLVRFRWLDERLAYEKRAPDVDMVTSERKLRERIWAPKIYLVNEQESLVLGAPSQDVIVTVQPNGMVTLATRVKVLMFCLMALSKFPFDKQRCPMVFESWTYNTSQMVLSWEPQEAVTVNEQLHLTEYHLLNMAPNFTMNTDALGEIHGPTTGSKASYFGKFVGNYSSLTVQFHLAREVGHYIMDYYVPSILLVVVSWVSFWLDPNAVPGRVALGTSTMLTFITLTRNTGSSLPKVSYIKATEIWFIVCTAFIFGSLVEFAFANCIWRRKQNVELKKVNSKYILKSTLTPQMNRKQINSNIDRCQSWPTIIDNKEGSPKDMKNYYISNSNRNTLTVNSMDSIQTDPYPSDPAIDAGSGDISIPVPTPGAAPAKSFTTMTPQEVSAWIDERSRTVFPALFVIFNILYWGFVWI